MSAKSTLAKLSHVLDEFRKLDAGIQTDTINVFLLITNTPGITSREIMDRTGMSQSSVSRHLSMLSEWDWKGSAGLNLAETVEDPLDRRSKRSWLTHKGHQIALAVAALLDPEAEGSVSEFPLAKEGVRALRGAR